MKTKQISLLFAILMVLLFASCSKTTFYQVYKTKPTNESTVLKDNLIYEDDNCKVSYNFWSDGGNIGFQFFNKTDKNIYLNLDESFFVLNGISNNYYKNRVFTTTSGVTSKSEAQVNYWNYLYNNSLQKSVGSSSSSEYSVAYTEEKTICIPSKTAKIISEYSINNSLFRDCDLFKYPTKKQIKTKYFTKSNSPYLFSNRIKYSVGNTDNPIIFENEFYISEITNYPEKSITDYKYEEFCNEKSEQKIKIISNASPDKFYIMYLKDSEPWKH